jgi:hypothetical protein
MENGCVSDAYSNETNLLQQYFNQQSHFNLLIYRNKIFNYVLHIQYQ